MGLQHCRRADCGARLVDAGDHAIAASHYPSGSFSSAGLYQFQDGAEAGSGSMSLSTSTSKATASVSGWRFPVTSHCPNSVCHWATSGVWPPMLIQ